MERSRKSIQKPAKAKKRISIGSAKSKGRELQKWVCKQISDLLSLPWGKDELIASREGAQSGTDVRLLGEAQARFSFSVECKSQQIWVVNAWIEQSKKNRKEGTDWLLVLKRNHKDPVVVMDAERFFALLKRLK